MRVLVVAVSARMLAQLAAAGGHDVVALDRFGDADLRALGPVRTGRDNEALAALAEEVEADAVVYGAGFENRPDLVERLAAGRELLGTPARLLGAARDPWQLAAAARAAGARAPEMLRPGAQPATPARWLRKPRAGGGGRGVEPWDGGPVGAGEVLQRELRGMSCSAVAIGDGRDAALLGVTEQLHRPGTRRWAGNVTPPRLPADEVDRLARSLAAVCREAARRFGVRGAFSVDAIWDGREAWVLELNPRPTASLELFGPDVFSQHVAGARGLAPEPVRRAAEGAKLVLFADRDLRAPSPVWWPREVRDVPCEGQRIARGAPVCTLVSNRAEPERLAVEGARLLAALPEVIAAGA